MKIEKIDWCQSVESFVKFKNRLAKAVLRDLQKAVPRFFSPCPFIGDIKIFYKDGMRNVLSIIPSGKYITKYIIVDSVQNCTIKLIMEYTIE